MDLELKHLAPYLPYGLKVKDNMNPKADITYQVLSISIENGDGVVVNYNSNNFMFIHEVKPILRPLSKLDWDIIFSVGIEKAKLPYEIVSLGFEYTDDNVECFLNGETHTSFNYCFSEQAFNSEYRFNQIAALDEIYRQHGDINFLIDAGLAIEV